MILQDLLEFIRGLLYKFIRGGTLIQILYVLQSVSGSLLYVEPQMEELLAQDMLQKQWTAFKQAGS